MLNFERIKFNSSQKVKVLDGNKIVLIINIEYYDKSNIQCINNLKILNISNELLPVHYKLELKKHNYKKIVLTPLMLVAGDHAKNDMAGDDEEAWNTLLKNEGYQVAVVLKGMGEYEGIRNIYIRHILEVIGDMKKDVA